MDASKGRFGWIRGGLLLCLGWSGYSNPVPAAEHYALTNRPEWVVPLVPGEGASQRKNDLSEGYQFLLLDRQVHVAEQTRYTHYAKQFLTTQGVQDGAQVSMVLDPEYERLRIHGVRIHRQGVSFDRLEPSEIRVIQQESDLARFLFNGQLSVMVLVPDVRVGDILEVEFSVQGWNPIFAGKFFDEFGLAYSQPVDRLYYRLLWPEGRALTVKTHGSTVEPVTSNRPGAREYVWDLGPVPAILVPDLLPVWYRPYPSVQLTEFDSWQAVAAWASSVYGPVRPVSPDLAELIDHLGQQHESTAERIRAALQFVQDDVRYLGIEVGPKSHQPSSPSEVYSRRFGDCKDKTVLLRAILKGLGIQSHPVLVNANLRHTVEEWAPSPDAFNHVILQVIPGEAPSFLCDPTLNYQRGSLKQLYLPPYGRGLVVDQNTRDLLSIPENFDYYGATAIHEQFDIADFSNPVSFTVESRYTGCVAESMRSSFQSVSHEQVETNYLNYYARWYPGIRSTGPVRFSDDPKSNSTEVREAYEIGDIWKYSKDGGERTVTLNAGAIRNAILRPESRFREMPLLVLHPRNIRQEITVKLPKLWQPASSTNTIDTPEVFFQRSVSCQGALLKATFDYRTRTNQVSARDSAKWIDTLNRIIDELSYEIVDDVSVPDTEEIDRQIARDEVRTASHRINASMLAALFLFAGFAFVRVRRWWNTEEQREVRFGIYRGRLLPVALFVAAGAALFMLIRHDRGLFYHLTTAMLQTGADSEFVLVVDFFCRLYLATLAVTSACFILLGKSRGLSLAKRYLIFSPLFLVVSLIIGGGGGTFTGTRLLELCVELLLAVILAGAFLPFLKRPVQRARTEA